VRCRYSTDAIASSTAVPSGDRVLCGVLGRVHLGRCIHRLRAHRVPAADEGYWQLWTVAPDGSEARQITRSAHEKTRCSWFPDGRSLLVNAQDGRLYRVAVESGTEVELAIGVRGMLDAVVSPDGRWIAFSLQRMAEERVASGDHNDIWVIPVEGGSPRRIAALTGLQAEPAWGADSRWVYFFSSAGAGAHQLWRSLVDGSRREQLTSDSSLHFDAAVSARGDVAYSSNASGNFELWLRPSGSSEARLLTEDLAADVRPSFGPEGDRLVFESSRDGHPNLWLIQTSGGEVRRLTNHPGGARSPAWGPRKGLMANGGEQ
jgi:TolB protein